ncbi:unnamed protein product [Didymodactylos carnosus]|uniref:CSD domain-containing protein n=1 Tax=Didymodactylos carnosus TaxID=1234261 RepID=A0A814FF31_9BILA|nr:unnamed protein product [Didymodactylos carnosus]CAF1103108.1 unnamed protein product [Didymodactylos carnosus]CAF3753490.1 unnamed protein product [Didymodactylos carnosus]CAF3864403.1 unnamed protein product [Didymodactylos carnosus]
MLSILKRVISITGRQIQLVPHQQVTADVSYINSSSLLYQRYLRCQFFSTDVQSDAQSSSQSQRQTGIVSKFFTEKGFGFITKSNGLDIFVHYKNINRPGFRSLDEGQSVEFDIVMGQKGEEARDVTIISESSLPDQQKRSLFSERVGRRSTRSSIRNEVEMGSSSEQSVSQGRLLGTVRRFSKEKGFGFILKSDGTEVFVHFSNINRPGFKTLEEKQEVEFEVVEGPKGLEARNVTIRE